MERLDPRETASDVLHTRYARAAAVFLAGSIVRGEATAASDLDGPPRWGRAEIDASRYAITDLLEDMRDPRSAQELKASAAALYPRVADHYLRSRQLWSARGKTVPRRLRQVSPEFAAEFEAAFDAVFARGDCERVFALCHGLLAPDGGALFDGYQLDAPEHWRKETLLKETP